MYSVDLQEESDDTNQNEVAWATLSRVVFGVDPERGIQNFEPLTGAKKFGPVARGTTIKDHPGCVVVAFLKVKMTCKTVSPPNVGCAVSAATCLSGSKEVKGSQRKSMKISCMESPPASIASVGTWYLSATMKTCDIETLGHCKVVDQPCDWNLGHNMTSVLNDNAAVRSLSDSVRLNTVSNGMFLEPELLGRIGWQRQCCVPPLLPLLPSPSPPSRRTTIGASSTMVARINRKVARCVGAPHGADQIVLSFETVYSTVSVS
ncbi:hypothetical protein BDV97DRAFT_368984 [Delphinella strobiligena]|nr:hypothetical protein BDV97DRAFT_368984 [Delphinella strobiligena]